LCAARLVLIGERRGGVVEAGLAGLTAALGARDAGWDVVVLEARTRVGGRVHTLHGGVDGVPFARGLRAEVGGESIDDTHLSLRAMVRRFGLMTERRPGSTTSRATKGVFRYRGQTYTFAEFAALRGGVVLADYSRVATELQWFAERSRIDPEHPERADRALDLDRMSFATWLDSLHLVPEARFVTEQENVSQYDAQLSDVSMLFVAQQTAVTAGMLDSQAETTRVTGGNATLPHPSVQKCPLTGLRTQRTDRQLFRRSGVSDGRSANGGPRYSPLRPPSNSLRDVDPPHELQVCGCCQRRFTARATAFKNWLLPILLRRARSSPSFANASE
jgi:monoamine oxidase